MATNSQMKDDDVTSSASYHLLYRPERQLTPTLTLVKTLSDGALKVSRDIKVLSSKLTETLEALRDFQKLFSHQYLVRIEQIFSAADTIYIVSEYCEGGNLSSLVSRANNYGEKLNEIEVMDWFVQILLALKHLHGLGETHGRLAPSSIYLTNNCAKLSEPKNLKELYHKYRQTAAPKNSHYVEEGLLLYSSPEVLEGGEFSNEAADMWSVGCILYEMCAGKPPFRANSPEETKAKIMAVELPPSFPTYYRVELADVWRRLLSSDPKQRPTAKQLLQEPFIAEHLEDMEESLKQQEQKCSQQPLEHEQSKELKSAVTCDYDEEEAEVDEDAILTEEDAFDLLSP